MLSVISKGTHVSEFNNPFLKEKVYRIDIEIQRPSCIHKAVESTVWMRSNDTSGNQKFAGDSLNEVISKVQSFIDSMD